MSPVSASPREPAAVGILIVDDEPLIAMGLEEYFRDLGFSRVFSAGSLTEAEKIMDAETPDFAVLDVNVGQSLVFPLAAELRRRHVPFFFSSGANHDKFPSEWKSYPFVPKPVTPNMLTVALARMGFLKRPDAGRPDEKKPLDKSRLS